MLETGTKRIIFSAIVCAAALQAFAVSPRESAPSTVDRVRSELRAVPERAGGIYYAYPSTSDSLPPVPEGYVPVYMSHYGRHGSRWVIKDTIYLEVLRELSAQRAQGNLTAKGNEVAAVVERCRANADKRWGELSQLGQRQHRDIAARMTRRFPSLFKGTAKVDAKSSTVQRCIMSMAAFTNELARLNPALDITMDVSQRDMPVISLSSKDAFKGLSKYCRDTEGMKVLYDKWLSTRDSLTRSEATAAKLFNDSSKVDDLPKVMRALYDVAISIQDIEGIDDNLLTLFEDEDLFNQWQNGNYRMYMENVNSSESMGPSPMSAVPLLDAIVSDADKALASSAPAANLRFGHDTALIRLLSLMGAESCSGTGSGLGDAVEAWQSYNISPMGANLQLAFFRNVDGNVIVSVRLNEKPIAIKGVSESAPGYYNWNDLRRVWQSAANPVAELIDRVSPGSAPRFVFEQVDSPDNFFEIDSFEGRPLIRGNNPVNIAAGLNWYLKYYAGVHLSWNNLKADLPEILPIPAKAERRTSDFSRRYYLNYCTHSYSMAFWDRERWQREIDWMALHGINMPLAITATDLVWRNTLRRLGYSVEEADAFVAGPAFQAWWLMNNLEGWGGPNSERWYADRAALQRDILQSMRRYGMTPVLPGYSGMVPHDADTRLGMEVSGKGLWNGFVRPAFLKTEDPQFDKIADIYYDELNKLCGPADYYSMDPFHEGGSTEGVDLAEAGRIITRAMKRANPNAVWVIQGWNENPREQLLDGVDKGDIVVLDLASEIKPNWGDPDTPSLTKRADGYGEHDWMFCMLLNFGGNVGLHGRMDNVIGGYYKALASKYGKSLTGVGLTPEGVENNPVMYELLSELIWRPEKFDKNEWLHNYAKARYGASDVNVDKAWNKLAATIYNCPWGNMQQGTTESVFCARPSKEVWQVSSWSRMAPYYEPADVIEAAKMFAKGARKLKDNPNYRYDLVDITRQAVAEKGRMVYNNMIGALNNGNMKEFDKNSALFLSLIKAQDRLLATTPDFSVQKWLDDARAMSDNPAECDLMESNARHLITTWGPRVASEDGGLRDYAHREWHGLLGDLYYKRWSAWINAMKRGDEKPIDFYAIDEAWVNDRSSYKLADSSEAVPTALEILKKL